MAVAKNKGLIERKNDLITRADEIIKDAETNKRELTDAEAQELAEIRDDVRKIKEAIEIDAELYEAATIDGAQEFTIYWKVIMPLCKPAWITLVILSFQQMWGTTGGVFIYSEELKPVSYVLSQLVSGGIARTGVSSAVSLIMMMVPVAVFVISQSNVIETMSTSGMKD
mgnify:CR=1 FL=1